MVHQEISTQTRTEVTTKMTAEDRFSVSIFLEEKDTTHTKVLQFVFRSDLPVGVQVDKVKKELEPVVRKFRRQVRFRIINEVISKFNENFKKYINGKCNCD